MKHFYTIGLILLTLTACSPKNQENTSFETKTEALATFIDTSTDLGDYGTVSASTTKIFKFKNEGDTAGAATPTLSDTDFSIVLQTGCGTVNVGATCTVRVSFNPTGKADGLYETILTVGGTTKNLSATKGSATTGGTTTGGTTTGGTTTGGTTSGGAATIEASISGAAVASPLDYGSFTGTQSSTKVIRLKNTGTTSTGPHTATLSDSDFTFTLNSCSNKTLAPNGTCDVRVKFNASGKTAQLYEANLVFGSLTLPVQATVAGATTGGSTTGGTTTGGTTTGGTTSGSAAIISFLDGTTPISSPFSIGSTTTTSITKIITIKNTGTVSTGPHTATLSDTDLTFSLNSCSSKTLAPNGSCTVRVTFNPTSKPDGEQGSTLTFGSTTIDLTATKLAAGTTGGTTTGGTTTGGTTSGGAAIISFLDGTTPISSPFSIGSVTTTSVTKIITIKNTGTASTGPHTAALSDTDLTFSLNSCSSKTLAPNGSCTVRVTFNPSGKVNGEHGSTLTFGSGTIDLTATKSGAGAITYTSLYSSYSGCTVTTACQGNGTEARTLTGCEQYTDGVLTNPTASLSSCSTTALTRACQSPPGDVVVTTSLPTGYDSRSVTCSAGQTVAQGTITDVTCSSNYTKQGLTCVENIITYTAEYSNYGACSVTQACEGQGTQTRTFTCRQFTNGVSGDLVDNSNCTPTALTQSCDSPAGSTTVTTGLATGYDSQIVTCTAGQTVAEGTITDVTCSSSYTKQGLTCVENVVQYTLDVGGPQHGTIVGDAPGTANDFTCGSGCASITKTLNSNDVVTLTFIPDSYYAFENWSQPTCTSNPCVLVMDSNKLVGTALVSPITPSNLSIVINSGETATTSSSAILTLAATNATEMFVTKDSSCAMGGSWEAYSTTKNVILSLNILNTFYVKFKNPAAESSCISSQILHDNQGPQNISVSHSSSPINQTNQLNTQLLIGCGDASHFMHSQANEEFSPPAGASDARWISCTASVDVTLAAEQSNNFKFYFKDNIGNISSLTSFTLIHNSALYDLTIAKTYPQNNVTVNGVQVCNNLISCTVSYPAGTPLQVIAEDSVTYGFYTWYGCPETPHVAQDKKCNFDISSNTSLTANYLFVPNQFVAPYAPEDPNPWNVFMIASDYDSFPTFTAHAGQAMQFSSSKNVNSLQVLEGSADVSSCNNAPGGQFSGCGVTIQSSGTLRIKAIINGTPNQEKEITLNVRPANEFGLSGVADLGKFLMQNPNGANIQIRSIELNDEDKIVFSMSSSNFNASYKLNSNGTSRDGFNGGALGVYPQISFNPNGNFNFPAYYNPSAKIGNYIYMAYLHAMPSNRQGVGLYRFNANTGAYDSSFGNIGSGQTVRIYKHESTTGIHESPYSIVATADNKLLVIARIYGPSINSVMIYKIEPSTGEIITSYASNTENTADVETQQVIPGVKTVLVKHNGSVSLQSQYYSFVQDIVGNLYLVFGAQVNDEPIYSGQVLWDYRKLTVIKLDSNGNLVSSYGGNGTGAWKEEGNLSNNPSRSAGEGQMVAVNSSGEVFIYGNEQNLSHITPLGGGSTLVDSGFDRITKLTSSGMLDTNFANNGVLQVANNAIVNLFDVGTGIAYWARNYDYLPTWNLSTQNLKNKLFKISYSGVEDSLYGSNSEFIAIMPIGISGGPNNIGLESYFETIFGSGDVAYSLVYGKIVKFNKSTGNLISDNIDLNLASDCSGDYPGQINVSTGLCECVDSQNEDLTIAYDGRCNSKVKNSCYVYDPMMSSSTPFGSYHAYSNTCDCTPNTTNDYFFNYETYSCDTAIISNNCMTSGGIWNTSNFSCDCPDGFFDDMDTTDFAGGFYDPSKKYCQPKTMFVNCVESGGNYSANSCSCGNGTYLESMTYKCLPEPGYQSCLDTGGNWNTGMSGQPGFCNCQSPYVWDYNTTSCMVDPIAACTQSGPNGYGTWTGTYCVCAGAYTWNATTSTCEYDPVGQDCASSSGIWDGVMGTCTCTAGHIDINNTCVCDEASGYYGQGANQCTYYPSSLNCISQGGTWDYFSGGTCNCGIGSVWDGGNCNCDIDSGYVRNSISGQCEYSSEVFACEHLINGIDVSNDPGMSWQTGDWMGGPPSEGGYCSCSHDPYTLFDSNLGCNNF